MLVQFDDELCRLNEVTEPPSAWRYEIFHIDGALMERYNRVMAEADEVSREVGLVLTAYENRRLQLSKEWAREKLAALDQNSGNIEWVTWTGASARLHVAKGMESVFILPNATDTGLGRWLGYRDSNHDLLERLALHFYYGMEAEWMQKLIAPPQGAQEV